MATTIETILGRDINSLKELKAAIKDLQDSMANLNPESEEFKKNSEQLAAAQAQLTAVTRAGTKENNAAADSIVGMEREYKNLYNTYKALTEEQRKSPMGQAMASDLEALSNKLNETKKGVGNFKDNIGRYSESVIDAFGKMGISLGGLEGPLKLVNNGAKSLGTTFKALAKNPWTIALTALIAILAKVIDAVKKNEELQMRWNEAMSVFQPILDKAKNAISALATSFVNFAEKIANAYTKLKEFGAGITDFLGITKGAKDRIKEQTDSYRELSKAQNDLIKQKREYNELNAKDNNQIETLMEEASETENIAEKKRLLNEAKDLQFQVDQRNIELAEENLRILEEEAKRTDNDTAAQDALSQALIDVENARATQSKNQRRFNREIRSATSGLKDYREEAKKLYEELNEYYKTDRQKTTEKYQKDYKLFVKYGQDTTLLTKKYNEDISKIDDEQRQKMLENTRAALEAERAMKEEIMRSMGMSESDIEYDKINEQVQTFSRKAVPIFENTIDTITEKWKNAGDDWREVESDAFDELTAAIENINSLGFNLVFPPKNMDEGIIATITKYKEYFDGYQINLEKLQDYTAKELSASKALLHQHVENIEEEKNLLLNGVSMDEYNEEVLRNTRAELEQEQEILHNQLDAISGFTEQKIELQERYYEVTRQLREQDWALEQRDTELRKQLVSDSVDAYNSVAGSINSVIGSIYSLIEAEMQDSKTTEKEFNRKKKTLKAFEGVMLAVTLSQIAASTAAGLQDVWGAYAKELITNAETAAAAGPGAAISKASLDAKSKASAILRTTGIAAQGAANMAAAISGTISKVRQLNDMQFGDGGGSAGLASNIAPISSEPYTYSRVLQTTEEYEELNRPIFVSVTDIDEGLGHRARVVGESSF